MPKEQRLRAYRADVTYGTNNEFGFDYLRDNLEIDSSGLAQRGYHYAIVDEVDSILIDEARTPLIISGAAEESAKLYRQFAQVAPRLRKDVDYEVEEKSYSVAINEEGIHKVEQIIGVDNLYDHINTPLVHHLTNALKAKELYQKDVAYVVKNGEVLIVDEFTGRLMPGRRWSDGLHQAVEAKEGIEGAPREPDPGHRHPPELLPHVRQTGGHDRNRGHRGGRVRGDLQLGVMRSPQTSPVRDDARIITTSSTRRRRPSSTR